MSKISKRIHAKQVLHNANITLRKLHSNYPAQVRDYFALLLAYLSYD